MGTEKEATFPTGTPPTIRGPCKICGSIIDGVWWQKLLVVNGATKGRVDNDKLIGDPGRHAEKNKTKFTFQYFPKHMFSQTVAFKM